MPLRLSAVFRLGPLGSRRLAPPTSALGIAVPPPIPRTDDAAPGRKSLARTGFYLAVLGLIPMLFAPLATTHMSHHGSMLILFIGVPLSVAGTAYGVLALRGPARARSSRVRRCAWIAIVLGELCVLGYLALLLFGDLVVSF